MKGIMKKVVVTGLALCMGVMMLSPIAQAHGHHNRGHHSGGGSGCSRTSCTNSRHNHRGCTTSHCTVPDCTGNHCVSVRCSGSQRVSVGNVNCYWSDNKDENVTIAFSKKVNWKKGYTVQVYDSKGNEVSSDVIDKDSTTCDLYVKGLKANKKYTVEINGIKANGDKSYGKAKIAFTS